MTLDPEERGDCASGRRGPTRRGPTRRPDAAALSAPGRSPVDERRGRRLAAACGLRLQPPHLLHAGVAVHGNVRERRLEPPGVPRARAHHLETKISSHAGSATGDACVRRARSAAARDAPPRAGTAARGRSARRPTPPAHLRRELLRVLDQDGHLRVERAEQRAVVDVGRADDGAAVVHNHALLCTYTCSVRGAPPSSACLSAKNSTYRVRSTSGNSAQLGQQGVWTAAIVRCCACTTRRMQLLSSTSPRTPERAGRRRRRERLVCLDGPGDPREERAATGCAAAGGADLRLWLRILRTRAVQEETLVRRTTRRRTDSRCRRSAPTRRSASRTLRGSILGRRGAHGPCRGRAQHLRANRARTGLATRVGRGGRSLGLRGGFLVG